MFTTGSRYMRLTWMLCAKKSLNISDDISIRFFGESEALKLVETTKKRNIYARHSWENNFYIQRLNQLSNHTIIEIFLPGDPNTIAEKAENIADLLEKIIVLSSTFNMRKNELQRKIGISLRTKTEIDFIIGQKMQYIKSRARPTIDPKGIDIDDKFINRFSNCGFPILFNFCFNKNILVDRVLLSLNWLFESRKETNLFSSFVKTAIALESLLIFSENESLARSLSERAAFILSPIPETRKIISRIIINFYDARSGIVHGSKKKIKKATPDLLEAMDRMLILILLNIASNSDVWPSVDSLRIWFEEMRWGNYLDELNFPFQNTYLKNAIKISNIINS